MDKTKIHNVSPLYHFYHSHEWPKPTYSGFYQRVKVRWMTPEEAILPTNRYGYILDDNGRECSKCKAFKSWDNFSVDVTAPSGRRPVCSNCVSIAHKKYSTSYRWSLVLRNYKIIYGRDNRKRMNDVHRAYVSKNREKYNKISNEYYHKNREKILKRRKRIEEDCFSKWEFIIYQWVKCKIISDYVRYKWCLVQYNQSKIWLAKWKMKPIKSMSYLEI